MQQDQISGTDPSGFAEELLEHITVYLDMMDTIDNCLKAYRNQYLQFYNQKLDKIQKKQENWRFFITLKIQNTENLQFSYFFDGRNNVNWVQNYHYYLT